MGGTGVPSKKSPAVRARKRDSRSEGLTLIVYHALCGLEL